LRDLILRQQGKTYQTPDILDGRETSFRDHIHFYLNMNKMPWSKLGIDILLGSKLDRAMTNDEAMFLPDYLEKGIDSSRSNGHPIVQQKTTIFQRDETVLSQSGFPLSPALLGWLLFALTLVASFTKGQAFKGYLAFIDFMIFFVTGLIGILLVFMWTGTDHLVCRDNFNLVWALPSHVLAAFFIRSVNPTWKKYFHFASIISLLLLLTWAFLPQELNPALIPFVLIMGLRAWNIAGRQTGFIWKKTSSSAAHR
jgi:hypothetical protein